MTKVHGVAVAGIGETEYYKRGTAPHSEQALALLAVLDACKDAGVDPRDVDGFASYGHDTNDGTKMARALGRSGPPMVEHGVGERRRRDRRIACRGRRLRSCPGRPQNVVVFRALAEGASGRLSVAVSAEAMNSHSARPGSSPLHKP